ncbi:MAG: class I adenylate-forming enzyme family protein [Pseudomonadota bacterium]
MKIAQPRFSDIPDFSYLLDYLDHYTEHTPDSDAAIDLGGRRLTYAMLRKEVDTVMRSLAMSDCHRGDRVAVLAGPSVDFWVAFLAIVSAGYVFVGLNPRYTNREISAAVKRADARLVLADGQFTHATPSLSESGVAVAIYSPGGLAQAITDVAAGRELRARDFPSNNPDEASLLVFTSGSTGEPKGAMLSETGLIQCSRVQAFHYCGFNERAFNCLPINHVGAICDIATTLLIMGGAQIFAPFDPALLWANLKREKVTSIGGVPTMLQMMFMHEKMHPDELHHVRRILWSGAMLPRALGEQLSTFGLPMKSFYGMTETTGSVTFTPSDASLEDLLATIGVPDQRYHVRIADPATNRLRNQGAVGEVQVRSPGVMIGYLNDSAATSAAFSNDGWFKTGDLASERSDGALQLSGRLKEMFKSGGYNIYPREIELALETMSGVALASVVPVTDPMYSEVGFAFIVPDGSTPVDKKKVLDHLQTRLANFKRPKHVEILLDPPILANGKIDRHALEERARSMV